MKHMMEIMATSTTNNHNQKELRLYAPNDQQQPSTTVARSPATGARSPFQREVREWQRIDPDTGALLTGRLEADRWINGSLNKYGKISDSQNISQPNGTQQTQRKQLEVLQTRTAAGGAMQVIRSQKVQTTSSRWSTSSASPLLLSASTSPIPQLQMAPIPNNKKHNNIKTTTTHNSYNTTTSSTSPFIATTLLTNGFHNNHYQQQQQQQQQKQFPHSLVNGSSGRNRNWPDLTENMSTLDICDNDHDNEHDHDNDYIVKHSSDDDDDDDDDNNIDIDSLLDDIHDDVDIDHDHDDHRHHKQYLVNERNNLKNQSNDNFTKRHSFTVLANNTSDINNTDHTTATTVSNHHDHHSYNLSRDSSSGSCTNSNQLFLLDTAPSLKLSNLMKSSSSLSNSSNNSTTASPPTAPANSTNSSALSLSSSMNTHKSMASKISLHAIVGSNNNNNNSYNTTTSSTPSPTSSTTTRPSWQQPTIYRQNSQNSNTQTSHNKNYNQQSNSHLMTTRVGDNNCCSSSSGDEARSYGMNAQAADLRHLHHQPSQQLHLKQNDRLTPTHSPLYNNRVDLESFRHYNTNNDDANNIAHDDDDGLRLTSRHLRRQQIPTHPPVTALQRSRSISTDDLSTEWDTQSGDTEEPSEWRRVSKLRRSFQSSTSQKNQESNNTPVNVRRPLDLPSNSVSVSKIRAELENSRRLNTVMKNNHVDLDALSSILNGTNEKETKSPLMPQRSTILTAESLKEIRGKLKKLSDESLYKDDFVINQQHPQTIHEVEHLVNDQTVIKRNLDKTTDINRVATKPEETNNKHTTNSLESRVKYKDTNSSDWHLRRKSYGFEKMSSPEKAMLRMDASTDSGLGRSGELQNWSPTSETNPNNRTVVRFSETAKVNTSNVQRRFRPQKSYEESELSPEEDMTVSKRHSIAVDESQYVHDNCRQTTQIHLNGFYEPGNYSKLIQTTESTTTTDFLNRGQQKRVEFSKTEVHFATESGRVNIVETDSKPPPTNNFRRRRSRSSSVGPLQSLVKSATTVSSTSSVSSLSSTSSTASTVPAGVAMPITLFGDDSSRKKTIASSTVAYRAALMASPEPKEAAINVTVSIPQRNESYCYSESSRSSYASTSGVDTTDCDTDEMTSLRGILKNKPAKPKPYVLGENIEKPDDLWGVQLKPIQTKNDSVTRDSSPLLSSGSQKTVAERIQDLGSTASSQTNGFSTKINVSLGGAAASSSTKNWEETGLVTSTQRRPSTQELLMEDLREHQKILDEGLKSTTLIIKTMRSASEFDEAMKRLSIASIEATAVQPTPMIRSNSYQESTQSYEFMEPEKQTLYKSTSFSSTSSCSTMSSSRKYSTDSRKTSTDSGTSFARKDSTPRLSFLGNEQVPVSQQLQRLRLIYDAATISQDEDSADEEVKSYFKGQMDSDSGGGTQESSSYEDDHLLEHSNSWSRLKAKKTIWKIDTHNCGDKSFKQALDKTDLPKSNVMSIKLHSPQVTTEMPAPLKLLPPVAKPRTISTVQATQQPKVNTATTVKQAPFRTSLPTKDSLKIIKEARGARQLRTHELSYFGVPVSTSEDEKPKSKYTTNANFRNSPKRSLPMRKLSEESCTTLEEEKQAQWQLDHDKPDLLKHNPIVKVTKEKQQHNREIKPAERTSLRNKTELDEEEQHLYENIANDITPTFKVKACALSDQYDRKMDLKRDAMILSEMNKNADQTLRELSDEAALKDRRRRSSQRRNSKPLETIEEKAITERINDTCIAVKISRATYASDAKKSSRHSTPSPTGLNKTRERTSSQSSVECCPRARSRSVSSEKEYENIKSKPSRSSQMVKHKAQKPSESRSSSLDSQRSAHSQYSSGDEQQQQQRAGGSFRREDRSRTKTKRISNSTSSALRDKHREDKPIRQSSSSSQQQHGASKRLSSTTHSSTHRERVECKQDNSAGSTTQQRHHHPISSELQRSTAITGSGRKQKDDQRDSQRMKRSSTTASGRSTAERYDSREHSSSKHATRSVRGDDRNSSQRSSHRLERADNDKERTSKSSKGHSSRSTSHHQHERTSTNPEKLATSKDSKTKSANTDNTTYVSVTNLAKIQTEQIDSLVNIETNNASQQETKIAETQTLQYKVLSTDKIPPLKPPRKKRKQSLIPIAIPTKPERTPPLPPQFPQSPASDSPTYEYKMISKNIPASYSNQSTLRKSSLPRPTSRMALLGKARKPSLKYTQSTSSSFAFLPYLPAKRNSDVSHVYDNYMLYAVPASITNKAYKQNLVNDHAQLFGSSATRYNPTGYGTGGGGHGNRRRTVRSSVSTHQPFGICTCS